MSGSKVSLQESFPIKANCECCCCKKYGYPKEACARTCPIWHARNDSSNVSSLLAPDLERASEKTASDRSSVPKARARRTIKSAAAAASKGSEVVTHCEECYCRENPNLPLLNLARKGQNDMDRWKTNRRRNICFRGGRKDDHGVQRLLREPEERTMRPCFCGNNGNETVGSAFAKDSYAQGLPKETEGRTTRPCLCVCNGGRTVVSAFPKDALDFTRSRNQYEAKNGDLYRIDESEEKSEEKSETLGDYKSEQTTAISSYDKPRSYKDFKELAKFRDDQYFDTHSTNDVAASVPPQHKCVHKFVIDDRLLPQPLNTDSYGVSRCDVCNKPMETFKSQRPRPRSGAKSINKVKEIYEYNLAPHRLNIGSGKEAVQIKVPEQLGREVLWQYNNFKIKRKVPGNSFALRYQRGRV